MREGVDMYCDNCHRQSPDNFVNCPYCSAPLKNNKRNKPQKFTKKKERKKPVSFKTATIIAVGVALALAICAIVVGSLTGSKPDRIVKTMVEAIESDDAELYYSLYDEQIKEFYKENFYYGDEETFDAMTKPLQESREFYASKCGEDFRLKYEIVSVEYLSDENLEQNNESLVTLYGYRNLPAKTAILEFNIEAKGDKGTYKSEYTQFYCSLINGKWYRIIVPTLAT